MDHLAVDATERGGERGVGGKGKGHKGIMMEVHRPLEAHIYQRGRRRIFLAGSIEQGRAIPWQEQVIHALKPWDGYLMNPRRLDWDDSWVQDIGNDSFRWQVEWELKGIALADLVLLFFDPETKSPITLLELGLLADKGKTFVACPDGFWRRGNVQVVCAEYKIPLGDSLDWLISHAQMWLDEGYPVVERGD